MKVQSLKMQNFRCFKELKIDFEPGLTVLVALNGQGKTSVLDALRIAFWPYLSAFDVVAGSMPKSGIEADDVRLQRRMHSDTVQMEAQLPARIDVIATHEGHEFKWARQRDKLSKNSKTSVKEARTLAEIGSRLQGAIRVSAEYESELPVKPDLALPVVAYYGTGRLWKQRNLVLKKHDSTAFFSRTYAYVGSLDTGSDYKYFADWFFYLFASDFEQKTRTYEKAGYAGLVSHSFPYAELISAISGAVDIVIGSQGWGGLKYSPSLKTLVMEHAQLGTLKVDQLSDGLKSMVAMVADIAYRCVRLNPHWGALAATKAEGIVMIDELDMHLHPEWQQTVIGSLREAFPNIQFIVTTHSPQVLSTVRREHIRMIPSAQTQAPKAEPPLGKSYGQPSGEVLRGVMLVDPMPPVDEKPRLQRLTELVDQGLFDGGDARQLMADLKKQLGDENPQLQRLERSIARQRALRG